MFKIGSEIYLKTTPHRRIFIYMQIHHNYLLIINIMNLTYSKLSWDRYQIIK